MLTNFANTMFGGRGHSLMHTGDIAALHEVRSPAVAAEQVFQLLARNARQQRGVVDLVAIQMKDGEYRTVTRWIQELVNVPGSGERSSFRLAVAHDRGNDEFGIVES